MINLENDKQLTLDEAKERLKVRKETAKVFTNWRKSNGYHLISGKEMEPGMIITSVSVTINPETKEIIRVFTYHIKVISVKPFITPKGFTNYKLKYQTEAGYECKENLPGYLVKVTVNKPSLDHPVDDIGCLKYHFYTSI